MTKWICALDAQRARVQALLSRLAPLVGWPERDAAVTIAMGVGELFDLYMIAAYAREVAEAYPTLFQTDQHRDEPFPLALQVTVEHMRSASKLKHLLSLDEPKDADAHWIIKSGDAWLRSTFEEYEAHENAHRAA